MKKIKLLAIIVFLLFFFSSVSARTFIDDWYIKDFQTEIILNEDSSILVTEKITADCGNLPGKHGIFRILPQKTTGVDEKTRRTPVEIISITDFRNNPHKYETIESRINNTITWKIGDPRVTVNGENYYKISYKVYNAVYDDVFHWNLLGNFWKLEIDNFTARVVFPSGVTRENISFDYYTGFLGDKGKDATYQWVSNSIIEITVDNPLEKREGITIKATLPTGIFTPHQFGFFELYLFYFYFLIPFFVLIFSFYLWNLYGKDYKIKRPVLTEFLRPKEIDLFEAGMFMSNGIMNSRFITALIVDMAVKGALLIKEEKKKFLLSTSSITVFKKIERKETLTEMELVVFDKIFKDEDEVSLESLKSILPKEIPNLVKEVKNRLTEKKLFYEKGFELQKRMNIISFMFLITGFISFAFMNMFLFISLFASFIIIRIFSYLMPKRTKEGVDLYLYLKGLKKYMSVAEKNRQAFYEQENIFEKLLPYAIVFGITHKWAKKMEIMYGEEFFQNYSPVWWQGNSLNKGGFNSFAKNLNSLSSQISSSHSSGGSGGSGGGGGGGGGGGW